MNRPQTKAKCRLCGTELAKSGMTRHLKKCMSGESGSSGVDERLFHLRIEGRYDPQYWMHIEVPASVTFDVIDRFLRRIWLECCGHMSAFDLGKHYVKKRDIGWFDDDEDEIMELAIGDVLKPKMKFHYEYDFGSSTYLTLQVVGVREGTPLRSPIMLLARNEAPELPCDYCGKKPSVEMCPICAWNGKAWVCKGCKKKHKCGEGMWMDVVNSPRVGTCGYMDEPDEEAVLAYFEQKQGHSPAPPSRKATDKDIKKFQEVADLVYTQMEADAYPTDTIRLAMMVWEDYVSEEVPSIRSVNVFAAALHYLICVYAEISVTQAEIARLYKTTPTSVSKRYREIEDALDVIDYFEDDEEDWMTMASLFGLDEEGDDIDVSEEQQQILRESQVLDDAWILGKCLFAMDDLDETMPLRPSVAFCMGGTGSYMRKLDASAIGYNAQGMFDLLVSSMVHPNQGEPGRCSYLAVVNEDYVEAFRSALAPFGVEVDFAGEELVEIVTSNLQEEMEKPAEETSFLDVERVDASCVASLFESSAALFESAPWEILEDSDIVSVDLSKWGMGERCICVMGSAGLQKGILMFDSYEDFQQFFRSTVEAARTMQPPKFDVALTALTFSPTSGVSRTQRRDAMENGWKLADVDAFPELAEIGVGAAPLPLRKESFVVATACAYALALFTRTHRKKIKKASGWMPGRKLPEMVRSEVEIPSFPDGPSVTVSFPHPTAHQQMLDAISQSVLIKPKKRR